MNRTRQIEITAPNLQKISEIQQDVKSFLEEIPEDEMYNFDSIESIAKFVEDYNEHLKSKGVRIKDNRVAIENGSLRFEIEKIPKFHIDIKVGE